MNFTSDRLKRLTLGIILALAIFPVSSLKAQIALDWSVEQIYAEYGILHYDFNRDGSVELSKFYLNSMFVYSGADSFSVIWSITARDRDQLVLWDEIPVGVNRINTCLFFETVLGDTTHTDVVAYPTLGGQQLWRTPLRPGYYTFLDTGDVNNDDITDIIYGLNQWLPEDSNYVSKFYVVNSTDGATTFESEPFDGYMIGPYVGDMDNFGSVDIIVNIYNYSDTTSTLQAFSYHDNGIGPVEVDLPRSAQIAAAFPNPFNSTIVIPFTAAAPSRAKVRIFDATGRTVGVILDGEVSGGSHHVQWDGKDVRGVAAPAGTYYGEIVVGSERRIIPLSLLR